ncbi:DUF4185 domain-containing protein [Luteipulveratus mongoliensis]|uniref:DUF4185 domain-containing protein n=1 Tax=Luteipulveratus mongoliensis TaxID=571913 RepID=A0A0K1JFS5_9MICO|nr:DUF4185 domain-containing protein [Luteipulveratus mongoliensis]AKU15559.1 hypothetical protein VV02_06290 [Luteipulveratus mongoliensis]
MLEKKTLTQLGVPSRRAVLRGTVGAAAAAALGGATIKGASAAERGSSRTQMPIGGTSATLLQDLTGPDLTSRFDAPFTDLGIPVRCADGSMLFIGGDTYAGTDVLQGRWSCPVGLRSSSRVIDELAIDSCVGGDRVRQLVDEPHTPVPGTNPTTAIPTDVFRVGDTLYMHLMRGPIYQAHHTDFWKSDDNGETWQFLCKWDDVGQYKGAFQQKTYAVADNGTAYVLSTRFDRGQDSDLLLHRVALDRLGDPSAYEPWGFDENDSGWAWGHEPTSVAKPRHWGEICFRAMDGKYAFTFFDDSAARIALQIIPVPEGDLYATPEQPLLFGAPFDHGSFLRNLYGGFIVPGSTFDDFHIIASQWVGHPEANTPDEYHFMHYRIDGISNSHP